MEKWFEINNLPIRYKLIIHFLLISIVPSIVLGILIGWAVERTIEQQVNENTLQLIDKVNSSLENYIENVQNMTYFISFNPNVQRFLDGKLPVEEQDVDEEYEIKQFLQSFTTLYPEVAGILVVNNTGDYISNELYSRTSQNLNQESWYREASENQGIFKILGHPYGRNITSHVNYREDEVVSVVRAIIDPNGYQVKGVVLIDLKIRIIAETVKDVRLGKTGYLMVIDENGDLIYAPAQAIMEETPISTILENNYGTFAEEVNGEKIQFIYRKSPFTNWTTVGLFSTKESVAEVQQIRFYVNSFLLFVCLVGITASYYLSHSMSKPIYQLMSAMQSAESGDLTSRYKGVRRDEVGRLGRSFNKMISQINKLIKLNERQEKQKREAELHTLQAHIKPHFLYNTLDTIQWMARKKGALEIAELVSSLSSLFRIGLSKGETIISLHEEIEHIKSYLMIQSTRYQEKVSYKIDIPSSCMQLSVLKIVLQPIVENAIYHGLKERRGAGIIEISAKLQEDRLCLQVQDNGKGMSQQKIEELQDYMKHYLVKNDKENKSKALKGYGIANVDARLKLSFGDQYGVEIHSELDKGTIVTIHHPILMKEKENDTK